MSTTTIEIEPEETAVPADSPPEAKPSDLLSPPDALRPDLVPGVPNEQVREILKFETIPPLAEFYEKIGWDPCKELEVLIDIIQDEDVNSGTRLKALSELRQRRNEILESSGLRAKATKVRTDKSGTTSICQADIVMAAMGFGVPGRKVKEALKGVTLESEHGDREQVEGRGDRPYEDVSDGRGGEEPPEPEPEPEPEPVKRKPGRPKGSKDSSQSKRYRRRKKKEYYRRRREKLRQRDEQSRKAATPKVKSVLQ